MAKNRSFLRRRLGGWVKFKAVMLHYTLEKCGMLMEFDDNNNHGVLGGGSIQEWRRRSGQ
jgi:hypothetical protein